MAASKVQAKEAYLVRPSSETVQRRQSVLALAQSRDVQSASKLLEAISDKDPMTRTLAVQGLGTLKVAAAVAPLSGLLASDPYPEVRQAAASSLRQIGDPGAVVAIDALGWSKDPAAEAELQSLLAQSPADSRPAVEEALARTRQLRKQ